MTPPIATDCQIATRSLSQALPRSQRARKRIRWPIIFGVLFCLFVPLNYRGSIATTDSVVQGAEPADTKTSEPRFFPAEIPKVEVSQAGTTRDSQRTGEDWPVFLGPRGTGISGETGLLKSWPEKGPPVLWKKKVGEGYAAPSIRGDRLVFFHRVEDEERVDCFVPETGESIWSYSYPTRFQDPYGYNGGPRCSPLLTKTHCYTFGAEGRLVCLDLATGELVWKRDTGRDFNIPRGFFGVGSTPILDENLLFVMVGGQPNAGMVAFDAKTGETVWKSVGTETFPPAPIRIERDRPPAKLASYSSPLIATIHGRKHLLCLMRHGLVSLEPTSGKVLFAYWFRSPLHDSVNAARPVVIGNQIFLSAAYETGAALLEVQPDGESVKEIWRDVDAMQTHWSTTIEHHGFLYGFSGRHEPGSNLRCLRAQDAKLMWRTHDVNEDEEPDPKAGLGTSVPKFYGRGSAILADGNLIVMGERGTLALVELNPNQFNEISRVNYREMGYPCWTAPVLSRQRLFITGARQFRAPGGFTDYEYHMIALDLAQPSSSSRDKK